VTFGRLDEKLYQSNAVRSTFPPHGGVKRGQRGKTINEKVGGHEVTGTGIPKTRQTCIVSPGVILHRVKGGVTRRAKKLERCRITRPLRGWNLKSKKVGGKFEKNSLRENCEGGRWRERLCGQNEGYESTKMKKTSQRKNHN